MKGSAYQRPLEQLLEELTRSDGGSAASIDAGVAALLRVHRSMGEELQFTPQGLAKRKLAGSLT